MRVARAVVLSSDQQEILESRARARSAPARSVERARIVLLAGAGPDVGQADRKAILDRLAGNPLWLSNLPEDASGNRCRYACRPGAQRPQARHCRPIPV